MVDGEEQQAELIALAEQGRLYGIGPVERRIDTHAARIFLTGDRAWKMKRAVRYPYLDFSTPDRRLAALRAELELNRRTAPELYRAVHAVTRDGAGRLSLDGPGATIDWMLEMRRFGDDALLSHRVEQEWETPLCLQLAEGVHALHDGATRADGTGADRIRAVIAGNRRSMARWTGILPPDRAAALCERQEHLAARHAALLDNRAKRGRVVHGHGDLHLANIALIDGRPVPFDCLEFDPELACVDVLYDLAFLLMDLWRHGLALTANRIANHYLDLSGRDEDALCLLPLFMSLRAAIRAHATAATAAQAQGRQDATDMAEEAGVLLSLAENVLEPAPPRLVAIGGLSGTGKTTLARGVAGMLGRPPGARILRSDVLRKRLAQVPMTERLPPQSYTRESSERVYAALYHAAAAALDQGQAVVADAMFGQRAERDAIEALARARTIRFDGLWLKADRDILAARVEARRGDASDADSGVVRAQAGMDVGDTGGWQRIDAGGNADAMARDARRWLDCG